jgi:hypothetical protein
LLFRDAELKLTVNIQGFAQNIPSGSFSYEIVRGLLDAEDIVGCKRAKVRNERLLLEGAVTHRGYIGKEINETAFVSEFFGDRMSSFNQRSHVVLEPSFWLMHRSRWTGFDTTSTADAPRAIDYREIVWNRSLIRTGFFSSASRYTSVMSSKNVTLDFF